MAPADPRDLILLVDDEPAVLTVLKLALEKSGFRVVVAGDGAEAFGKFIECQSRIRLVITDMAMPGMNGLELIRALRERGGWLDVVVTTGMTTPEQMQAIRDVGVSHVLSKPCSLRQMLDLVRQIFRSP